MNIKRFLYWLLPVSRVRYRQVDPELKQQRYWERVDRMQTFVKHKIPILVNQAAVLVLENAYKGPYRTVWHLFWMQVKSDFDCIRDVWQWRFQLRYLMFRGMSREAALAVIEKHLENKR